MDKAILRSLLAFLVLLSFCAGVLSYLLMSGNSKIDEAEASIIHTNRVILKAEELSTLIEGLVSSQRGYLLSGKEYFLKDYDVQKAGISEHIANLSELTGGDKSQESRLDEIRNRFSDLIVRIEDRTKEYRPVKVDEYLIGDMEITNSLKNDIIRTNDSFLKEEKKLLGERTKILRNNKDHYLLMLITGLAAGTAALVIFNGFLFFIQSRKMAAERSLKDSKERFALVIQGTNDGIFDWNLKNGEVFYSKQLFAMLGYDRESFIGDIENFTSLVHPNDLPRVWQYIESYLHRELMDYSNTFRMRHAEPGRWVWINSRAKAIYNRDGEAVRMVGAHTDITFMKEYQEKLKEEKHAAERENQAKSDFLAHMSHEIRTPLTAISGVAEILQNQGAVFSDKQKQLVRTLHSSASTLKDIVNDILDFSKIESGELQLEEARFPLQDVLEQVVSLMAVNAKARNLDFIADYQSIAGMDFYGDRLRLRQILINLIGNAIKFTTKGSVTVRASHDTAGNTPALKIEVADTGIGIARENFDLIFERFKQADSSVSRKYGGTGLGLAISKNLARLMGGTISLDSELGKGSVFTLILPMHSYGSIENRQDPILSKKILEGMKAPLSGSGKILIVEDYEGNIVVVSYILDDIGCSYDVARTGLEALNLWKEKHYDLILMDIQMPEMDGFTATSQIRKMEAEKNLPHTPIIGMTAHALIGDKNKCIAVGMDAYLPKPLVENDLKTKIMKFLSERKKAA